MRIDIFWCSVDDFFNILIASELLPSRCKRHALPTRSVVAKVDIRTSFRLIVTVAGHGPRCEYVSLV